MAAKDDIKFRDFEGSKIWNHFKRSICGKLAECKTCRKVLKCEGGSTKGLHGHLRSVHQIEVLKRPNNEESEMESCRKPISTVVRKLDYYMSDTSLQAVLARMTACDGLSFNIFTTSSDLRKSLTVLGYELPKSVVGIRDQVIKYGKQLRDEVTRNLRNAKSKGEYFSLTLDEWTSMQNKRYLNINIHGNGFFWNLGLMRIKGKFSAELCSDLISQKLSEFGIDFGKDVVSITTDGCAMMKKLGRIVPTLQQLCYAHGLQLAIQDVFYCNKSIRTESCNASQTDDDDDNEGSNDDDGLVVLDSTETENAHALNFDVSKIVNKVRRIVKIFKRSPLKNEVLQRYVKDIYPNGLNVILDCKTRWSSLINMLERIIRIKLPIQKALLDLGVEDINIVDQEFEVISSIVEALKPIRIALDALCRRDANLITAEATVKFVLDEIHKSQSYYNIRIQEAINQRIVQERYTETSIITQYLHNPSARLEKKAIVNTFCADILTRMLGRGDNGEISFDEAVSTSNTLVSQDIHDPENISIAEKLQHAIDESMTKPHEIGPQNKSISSLLKYELTIAEQTGKRGYYLEKIYQMLLTIPATSVEAERVFSSSAYLCNRFRTRLGDKTLDTLTFIRNNTKKDK